MNPPIRGLAPLTAGVGSDRLSSVLAVASPIADGADCCRMGAVTLEPPIRGSAGRRSAARSSSGWQRRRPAMSPASPTAAPGCLVIGQVAEVFGVVERAVGQVAAVERWCRPATTARRRPGRRRTGIGAGRRAGGRPSRIRHTVGTGSITTTTARPRTGCRLLIWRVSGHVMCEQASRRGPAGRWRAALPRARRPLPCSCCCR